MRNILVIVSVLLLGCGIWLLVADEESWPIVPTPTDPAAGTADASRGSAAAAELEAPLAPIPASPFDGSEDKAPEDAAPVATGVTVTGRIINADGTPASGAPLVLRLERIELGRMDYGRRRGETDADGRFKFLGIAIGTTVELRATPLAGLDVSSPMVLLGATDHDFGTLIAERGAMVRGVVLSARGAPAPGIRVIAKRARRSITSTSSSVGIELPTINLRAAMSDAKGRFCIQGLPTDGLHVSAREAGSALAAETTTEGEALDLRLTLPEGAERTGLVTDEAGAPISGALVRVSEGAPTTMADFQDYAPPRMRPQRLTTDAGGRFSLKNVPSDLELRAFVACEKFLPAQMELTTGDNTMRLQRAGVVWGVVRSSDGTALASFQGTVPNANWTGLNPDDAAVATVPRAVSGAEASELLGVPASEGLYAIANLRDGSCTLAFSAAGHARVCYDNVAAAAGTVQRLDITLDKQCEVSGIVTDPAGATVAGARVTFTSAVATPNAQDDPKDNSPSVPAQQDATSAPNARHTARALQSVETDAKGCFRIECLPTGPGSLVAEHELFADSEPRTVNLQQGAAAAACLTLRAAGSIEGLVKDQNGKAMPHASIIARAVREKGERRPMREELEAMSDASGNYRMAGVFPGAWDVRLDNQGRSAGFQLTRSDDDGASDAASTGWKRCDVRAGAVTRMDLAPPITGLVSGVVRSASRPVAGMHVELAPRLNESPQEGGRSMQVNPIRRGSMSTTTDADGRFRFERQQPGEYTLTARPLGSDNTVTVNLTVQPRTIASTEIVLPGGTIEGQVLDDKTGAPLAHVRVQGTRQRSREEQEAHPPARPARTITRTGDDEGSGGISVSDGNPVVTDAEGHYALRFLPRGSMDLAFSGGGIVPGAIRGLELGRDALRTGVRFRASLGCTLTLHFGPDSDPSVEFANVQLQCGELQEHVFILRGQRTLKRGLKPGPCTLTALLHDGTNRKVEKTITLHADGENRVQFEF